MRIRLGLHLDGQRGWREANRLGDLTTGPLGLLNVLETQLGLLRERPSQSERIVQYRDCLASGDRPDRFYHRTFATDELGTAATLLDWRDRWYLHGWNGRLEGARSARLRDLGEIEAIAAAKVAPSIGERLGRVGAALELRRSTIVEVTLVDPLPAFPPRWQKVLERLSTRPNDALDCALADGWLGQLQAQLRKAVAGDPVSKLEWQNDGSVTVVQAETRLLAGRWLADRIAQLPASGLLVVPSEGALLDGIIVAADGARQGFQEASSFRPALQVLPLALELLWEPLNFYGLMQFLTHPICPVAGFARRRLAAKLADRPGIGGQGWREVLQEIDAHYGDKAGGVRAAIQQWIEHPRFDPAVGAPLTDVLARIEALADFFRARLATDDLAARAAYSAGFAQSRACANAVEGLRRQGVVSIRPRQLQQLVIQATARGSENPLLVPEVGAWAGISDPAAAIEHFDQVVWWHLALPALPPSYPWAGSELVDLAGAGVCLPPMAEVLERMSRNWLRPILAARKQLTLVLPPQGEELHPVWLMIGAVVKHLPVEALEQWLDQPNAGQTCSPITHVPLPTRRRWWQLPDPPLVTGGGRASFTSLELYLFNPYQWLLKYPAGLRPSRILDVSDNFRLFGNLAHRLVELHFSRTDALTGNDAAFLAWFERNFDRLVAEEGAVLLMPGRRSDLESFRLRLRDAMRQLRHQIQSAAVAQVVPEPELTGTYPGGEVAGYADLVLTKPNGSQAIIDMKWSGSKKFPEKLRQNRHLQLAIYAELWRQKVGKLPKVAYFVLDRAQLYATDTDYFPSGQVVQRATAEGTGELWARFVEAWQWRSRQVAAGRYEVVLDGVDETPESIMPADALGSETLNEAYNDYLALAGWEG